MIGWTGKWRNRSGTLNPLVEHLTSYRRYHSNAGENHNHSGRMMKHHDYSFAILLDISALRIIGLSSAFLSSVLVLGSDGSNTPMSNEPRPDSLFCHDPPIVSLGDSVPALLNSRAESIPHSPLAHCSHAPCPTHHIYITCRMDSRIDGRGGWPPLF